MPSSSPRLLLITPPLTQLNTPYPATAYIKGFLGTRGYEVRQADLSIELVLRLFSKEGLTRVFDEIEAGGYDLSDNAQRMLRLRRRYEATIGPAIRFCKIKTSRWRRASATAAFCPKPAASITWPTSKWLSAQWASPTRPATWLHCT